MSDGAHTLEPSRADRALLDQLDVSDLTLWENGPPHDVFRRMREHCPVHRSARMSDYRDAPGFWSLTTQEHVREVSRDWKTFSSETGGHVLLTPSVFPLELLNSMFIGMDPPKHDRLKALFQAGFSPRRIAQHSDAIRTIAARVLDNLASRETIDVVADIAQPIVSRVIGSYLGIAPEDDAMWAGLMNALALVEGQDAHPGGVMAAMTEYTQDIIERCRALIADRVANPTGDLLSVLVHSEVDGEPLTEIEIVTGFVLLMFAGMDSTKATYASGLLALLGHPDQRQLLADDPALIVDAVEEMLRMFPPFAHFSRTATRAVTIGGQEIREGDRVAMWYPSTGRDEAVYADADRFDVRRRPEHMAFGGGGRHFCLGAALARLELRIMFEETLARFPTMRVCGPPVFARSILVSQLTSLPVRLQG